MHSGKELGKAIREAMRLKGVTQKAVAEEFAISQPSVSNWIQTGRIDKAHIDHLVAYFGDVVGLDHWGLTQPRQASEVQPLTGSATAGQLILAVSRAVRGLPERNRRFVAEAASELIVNGPLEAEALQIDAIARVQPLSVQADEDAPMRPSERVPVDTWEETVRSMAESWRPGDERDFLLGFLRAVDEAQGMKEQLHGRIVSARSSRGKVVDAAR